MQRLQAARTRVEAALHEWVQDRSGRLRDILVLTYELDGFTDQAS